MTSPRTAQIASVTAVMAAALAVAGCGSTPARHARTEATTPGISLNTATSTAGGTWATVVMGGLAARHENFWQVFVQPSGTAKWLLVTPPGTADNGGLVLSAGTGQTAVTAFRPSQLLTYTPLIATSNGGRSWSALSPLDASLADVPGALTLQPGTGRMAALTTDGTVEQESADASGWQKETTTGTLASTPAGRRCDLTTLTAVAYTPSGVLVGGGCRKAGAAGLFLQTGDSWQATGPSMPGTLAGQPVSVLRLTATGHRVTAVLQAGDGQDASVLAAWLNSHGQWTLSKPLPLDGTAVTSASLGPSGAVAVATTTRTAALISSTGGAWQALPRLPAGTVTLAIGASGTIQALAVSHSTLLVWQHAHGSAAWSRVQAMKVPIQYGSSGSL
jgi:hypothetical protein